MTPPDWLKRPILFIIPASVRARLTSLDLDMLGLLGGTLLFVVAVFAFLAVAGAVTEGSTQKIDEAIVQWFRQADDPALAKGPPWLREAIIDITALGSTVVTSLLVLAISGFLWIHRERRLLMLLLGSFAGGMLINYLMKLAFARPRPSVVPHLREIFTPSFPSGHAALSAIVFLTVGVLLFEVVKGRQARLYCLGIAIAATMLVGFSRVYLGVHYPSDVLAGWVMGIAWATACWVVAQYLGQRRKGSE
ncbi:MAG: phosphatase PAP2 family protein [Acidobacteriota bacterium]|nr:phosphatase PAP2 family protein [Acidobacteriota bacterium]